MQLKQVYHLLPNHSQQIGFCLHEMEQGFLCPEPTKLKQLLSKDLDTTFDTSQKLTMEILLSHRNSPLFANSTPEGCYKIIFEIKSCLSLTDDEAIEAMINVGVNAVDYMSRSSLWTCIMYIKIPQIISLFQSQSLLTVLGKFYFIMKLSQILDYFL